eukprot:TRINITY_DN16361_c0_g1::TRINITY_DN16361_c0_g1_i1::g.29561::m.29561 TRINITY_DN16361_c0_g1::TRINITY_DN16361_c0_g1_i1::g.29561  ORF type:complete len:263 (-),score=23.68,sp/Q8WXA9/SREK1_HUMAN/35.77/6e-14,RRM_6/PF14259.1/7.4e-05,RRM_6/PF14259.1/3.4e-08,RRM_1/PF00076.17/0.0019,RRM_1/PF00076.17/4.2e-09,RRM_5/PF13893.1/1.2,RRM_5/PF13893.1/0.02,RRM_3/PF08777.6/0.0051,Nup35_RRM/PF05172.8/0.019 TRINITY_DN16361_c0_g1_i1:174-962(-)
MAANHMDRTIYASDISTLANEQALRTFFSFCGQIEFLLYKKETADAIVRFATADQASQALGFSGTHLIDRAVKVQPGSMAPPSLAAAAALSLPPSAILPMLSAGMGLNSLTNPLAALGVTASVPSTTATPGMANTDPFPGMTFPANLVTKDPTKADEIARTVYVGNLDPSMATEENIMREMAIAGPTVYCRIAGDLMTGARYAFVEYLERAHAARALSMNGHIIHGRPIARCEAAAGTHAFLLPLFSFFRFFPLCTGFRHAE